MGQTPAVFAVLIGRFEQNVISKRFKDTRRTLCLESKS